MLLGVFDKSDIWGGVCLRGKGRIWYVVRIPMICMIFGARLGGLFQKKNMMGRLN